MPAYPGNKDRRQLIDGDLVENTVNFAGWQRAKVRRKRLDRRFPFLPRQRTVDRQPLDRLRKMLAAAPHPQRQAGVIQLTIGCIVIGCFQPADCPLVAGRLQNGGGGSNLIERTGRGKEFEFGFNGSRPGNGIGIACLFFGAANRTRHTEPPATRHSVKTMTHCRHILLQAEPLRYRPGPGCFNIECGTKCRQNSDRKHCWGE